MKIILGTFILLCTVSTPLTVWGLTSPSQGGTGLNTSASTGHPRIDAGTWAVVAGDVLDAQTCGGGVFTTCISTIGSATKTLRVATAVTVSANTTVPSNVTLWFVGTGQLSINSGVTVTVFSPERLVAEPRRQVKSGLGTLAFTSAGTVYPGWFGAKGDGTTDDTSAIQAAVTPAGGTGTAVYFPSGRYKVTSPINLPNNPVHLTGAGVDQTTIYAVGTTAFTIAINGTTGAVFEHFRCEGNGTATKACFDTTPTNNSDVVAKNHWRNLRLVSFDRAFIVPNVQISDFVDIQVDGTTGGSVFYIHPPADGLQSNSNRVERLQVTGQDVQVWDVALTATRRATNWTLRDSDLQQTGTVAPITISDTGYILDNIEFENSSANHLVILTADNVNAANFARLTNLQLTGGAGGTNGKILSQTTGSQQPYYVTIANCDAGAISERLIDFNIGRAFTFDGNQGVVFGDGGGYNDYLTGSDRVTGYTTGDTTPSVRGQKVLVITNSSPTTITDFDDGVDQQAIKLIFTDSNTTITDAGNLKLNGTFTSTADDTLTLVRSGAVWYEVSRSAN